MLGGGQLGRMFAMAARRLGYRVHTLAPEHDTPTGQIADVEINAAYDDIDAVRAFAQASTSSPSSSRTCRRRRSPRRRSTRSSGPTAARWPSRSTVSRRRRFSREHGLPVAPFAPVRRDDDLAAAIERGRLPVGAEDRDVRLRRQGPGADRASRTSSRPAWEALGRREAVLEAFLDLEREISVIGARGVDGEWSHFGPIENAHAHHILDVSVAPANVPEAIAAQAVDVTRRVMDALDFVGILCIEFFITRDGRLLVNELAPRPHNSGHLTFDACRTSQFEQQLRAVCGLPLGSPEMLQPAAAMANMLGDIWAGGDPNWAAALAHAGRQAAPVR